MASLIYVLEPKQMYTRVNPSFSIQMWDVRGYSLHGHVIMRVTADRS